MVIRKDWKKNLLDSRDVASELSAKLRSWDTLCRKVIKVVKTEEQRKQALALLKGYKEIDSDRSRTMTEAFNGIREKLNPFSDNFASYLTNTGAKKGVDVDKYAQEVRDCTEGVRVAKEALDRANKALIGTAAGAWIWLLPLLGSTAAVLVLGNKYKDAKKKLAEAQSKLRNANKDQDAVASLKTTADQLIPTIVETSSDLGIFSSIWAHVRNQAVEIETHLKAGRDAAGSPMFALELEHAEILTLPLADSLRDYASQILD
ncbi:hypothetical protein BDZ94DRAFT_85228 [Collybia nuda]|uniref:Uncharacterized protein n=1 Tax=Collybia nuda TaxID=64659 RepID=A0A9P5YE58_9AGAR|nr:hypothetical protein BDZ94DRAFT_85228 [Collybia nuda]